MKTNKDNLLKTAIEYSGFYMRKDVDVTLDDSCDLSFDEQVELLLARELVKFRPDLMTKQDKDIVYIVCDGDKNYSLPSNDLTSLLEEEKPYDDAVIAVYSLTDKKIVNKLYKGDGTKWISYRRDK